MNLTEFALRNQPLVFIVVIALVAFSGMALQNFPNAVVWDMSHRTMPSFPT